MRLQNQKWLLISFLYLLSACDGWPPSNKELVRFHNDHLVHLETVMQLMSGNKLVALRHGSSAYAVYVSHSSDEVQVPLDNKQGQLFRDKLEAAEIYAAYKINGSFYFQPYFSHEDANYWYRARIVYTVAEWNTILCADISDLSQANTCQIPIEENWKVEYSWFPISGD